MTEMKTVGLLLLMSVASLQENGSTVATKSINGVNSINSTLTNMLPSNERVKPRCNNIDMPCLLGLSQLLRRRKKPKNLRRKQRLQNKQYALSKTSNVNASLCDQRKNYCRHDKHKNLSANSKQAVVKNTKTKGPAESSKQQGTVSPLCKPNGVTNLCIKKLKLIKVLANVGSGSRKLKVKNRLASKTTPKPKTRKVLIGFPQMQCRNQTCQLKTVYKWFNLDNGNELDTTVTPTQMNGIRRQKQRREANTKEISVHESSTGKLTDWRNEASIPRASHTHRAHVLQKSLIEAISKPHSTKDDTSEPLQDSNTSNKDGRRKNDRCAEKSGSRYHCYYRLIVGKRDDNAERAAKSM